MGYHLKLPYSKCISQLLLFLLDTPTVSHTVPLIPHDVAGHWTVSAAKEATGFIVDNVDKGCEVYHYLVDCHIWSRDKHGDWNPQDNFRGEHNAHTKIT